MKIDVKPHLVTDLPGVTRDERRKHRSRGHSCDTVCDTISTLIPPSPCLPDENALQATWDWNTNFSVPLPLSNLLKGDIFLIQHVFVFLFQHVFLLMFKQQTLGY